MTKEQIPELSDSELAALQVCMSYADLGRVTPADADEIRLQGTTQWGMDLAADIKAILGRLVDLGYLTPEEGSGGRYYRIASSGRARVLKHAREWKGGN